MAMAHTRLAMSLDVRSLRWILLVGAGMMGVFIFIDLAIVPDELTREYLVSRLVFQIPALLLLLAYTYHRTYEQYQQSALLLAVVVVTYANYWLIQQSWNQARFAFSYEGTLLYTFFGFFVVRMNFKFGITYVLLSLSGFAALMMFYPIYGDYNFVNLGFVAMAQSICLVGLFTLTRSLQQVDTLAERLHALSRLDQLTGLFNRRAYEQDGSIQFEQAKRSRIPLSVYLVDIDNFKDYNDGFGHQQGDVVIRMQADILRAVFRRQMDIIGRFGGEEFIIIAGSLGADEAQTMAQRILDQWAERKVPHGKGKGGPHVTCSIGVSILVPSGPLTLVQQIEFADRALYRAKENGRNRFEVATAVDGVPEIGAQDEKRLLQRRTNPDRRQMASG